MPESNIAIVTSSEVLARRHLYEQMAAIKKILSTHSNRPQRAYEIIQDKYVQRAERPELADFTRLLLLAPAAIHCHASIVELRELRQRQGGLSEASQKALTGAVMLACDYMHQLTVFIRRHRAILDRRGLGNWLADFAAYRGGRDLDERQSWARRQVSGAIGEAVGADLLQVLEKQGLITNLRYSTPADDMMGYDLRCDATRRGIVGFDFKTGQLRPTELVTRDRNRLIVSINPVHIYGFELVREKVPLYIQALKRLI